MNRLIVIWLIITVSACSKNENIKQSQNTPRSFVGTWELRETNSPKTTYSFGNGNTVVFTETLFKNYRQNKLIDSGSYNITSDSFIDSLKQWRGNISMNNLPCYFTVHLDTLEIDFPGIVFENEVYVKINE